MGLPVEKIKLATLEISRLKKEAGMSDLLKPALRYAGSAAKSIVSGPKNFIQGIPKSVETLGHDIAHPIKAVKSGWLRSSPTEHMKTMTHAGRESFLRGAGEHLKGYRGLQRENILGILRNEKGIGSKIRGTAEELSRRGWTGKKFKYLPVGEKGMSVGLTGAFAYPAIRDSIQKGKVGPTGEGGVAETGLGELAGLGGFIAGTGRGLIPGMGAYYLANKAGGTMGRVIDRLRGGANLRTALFAPPPSEVDQTIENIQRYYQ